MSDRAAIVTAAGRGIGAAVARRLAADGYRLALMSPSGASTELAAELDGFALTGSVTEPDDLAGLVAATMDRYGRVDAVVNHTGSSGCTGRGNVCTATGAPSWPGNETVSPRHKRCTVSISPGNSHR